MTKVVAVAMCILLTAITVIIAFQAAGASDQRGAGAGLILTCASSVLGWFLLAVWQLYSVLTRQLNQLLQGQRRILADEAVKAAYLAFKTASQAGSCGPVKHIHLRRVHGRN